MASPQMREHDRRSNRGRFLSIREYPSPMAALVTIAATVLWVTILTGISWAQPATDGLRDDQVPIIMPLVGRTLEQVVAQLGRPYEVFPLRETGGKLLMFENERHDHFIIETDGMGIVVDAYVKHPDGR
jgi:hypothetical protein